MFADTCQCVTAVTTNSYSSLLTSEISLEDRTKQVLEDLPLLMPNS